ncbi:MAG: GNAT family N-acetyltransferase [Alphaproteobacteria bacterium]|nr:GNAT family N-acetyltransferase [Alphaproteobacteria bacterium]
MLPFEKATSLYVNALSTMHSLCFKKAWDEKAFADLLCLPTTVGYLNDCAFVLFSVCDNQAEILTLGVVPDARKKGVASSLLKHSFDELKKAGVKEIFLDVNVNNLAARKLYEKAGFEQISVRKNYYDEAGQKSDALVLKKAF